MSEAWRNGRDVAESHGQSGNDALAREIEQVGVKSISNTCQQCGVCERAAQSAASQLVSKIRCIA